MRQGIVTKYIGPTNSRGSRIKAVARKASSMGAEMSLTEPFRYEGSTESEHTRTAKALATKLGWSGLWVGGGNVDETGFHYVCLNAPIEHAPLGGENVDWFYVAAV